MPTKEQTPIESPALATSVVASPVAAVIPVHEAMRARRLEKGFTFEKVREDTKIPIKYLQALEEGRYNVFPAKVYCRGFFMTYVRHLGMGDPMEQWERLQNTLNPKEEHSSVLHRREDDYASSVSRRHQMPTENNLWSSFVLWSTEGQNWILAFLVFPVLVIGGIYGIYSYTQHQSYRVSPRESLDIPKIIGQTPSSNRPSMVPGMAPAAVTAPVVAAGFSAEIAAKSEPSWIHVEMDGKLAYQGILPSSQKRTFQVRQNIKMRIGNPKNTDLRVNGNTWIFSPEELERTPLEVLLNLNVVTSRFNVRGPGSASAPAASTTGGVTP